MSPETKAIFFIIAVVCFAVAAFVERPRDFVNLGWLGLAFFAFPFFWDAVKAS